MPTKKRKKTRLTKRELDHYKKKIIQERERILIDLGKIHESINSSYADGDGSKHAYSNHLADLGTDYMEQEKNLYYASKEGQLLRALDEALRRIDSKEYGKCSDCGELISLKRLEALPNAVLCIKCQSENEKNQKGL